MKKELCLFLSAVLLLSGLLLTMQTGRQKPTADYEIKMAASGRLQACFTAIRELRKEKALPFTEDDIHETGLIGEEYSFITTTLGNLEAKRSTVNPNWAAVLVDMFSELQLEEGDCIAVNCSGSFPALNLAVLCAAEEYGLEAIVISSFGASTHGANEPSFTYQDMEQALYERGLLHTRSLYFSIGGRQDLGLEMEPSLVSDIVSRLQSYGYEFLYYEDLLTNIAERHALYQSLGEIRCFVNVGGNDVSFGDSKIIVYADGGILTDLPDRDRSTGLVQLFLRDGIPCIHLLNIKSLSARYGLPVDPESTPAVGEGNVYLETVYSRPIAAGFLVSGFLLLMIPKMKKKR